MLYFGGVLTPKTCRSYGFEVCKSNYVRPICRPNYVANDWRMRNWFTWPFTPCFLGLLWWFLEITKQDQRTSFIKAKPDTTLTKLTHRPRWFWRQIATGSVSCYFAGRLASSVRVGPAFVSYLTESRRVTVGGQRHRAAAAASVWLWLSSARVIWVRTHWHRPHPLCDILLSTVDRRVWHAAICHADTYCGSRLWLWPAKRRWRSPSRPLKASEKRRLRHYRKPIAACKDSSICITVFRWCYILKLLI